MSSTKGQSKNYLSPPYANSDCASLRSCSSICSSISSAAGVGEVHINAAYDNLESGDVTSSLNHDYEDLQSIRTDLKELPAQGRRSRTNELYEPTGRLSERARQIKNGLDEKDLQCIRTDLKALPAHGQRSRDNDLYEPTGPMKHRVRQITECSDDSNASVSFNDSFLWKKDSCLSKLILCLILAFSVAALVLVILIINGTVGPKCGCKDLHSDNSGDAPRTGMQSVSVQNLLRRIEDLENNMLAMESKMKARDNAVQMFVTKHESQVEVLKAQVNETANKIATVDGVWVNMTNTHDAFEKKLDTEFKQLNNSVKELNKNDQKITSTVNELRQNQILTKRMSERLAINVTELETRVQGLGKTSSNISSRVARLEKGYAEMNILVKALQALNGAQNASLQDLQAMHNRLKESLTTVNVTVNEKLNALGSKSGKPAANFSMCQHKFIKGTPSTVKNLSGALYAYYTEPKDRRAMGITCSSDYAQHHKLTEPSKGVYKCSCRDLSPTFSGSAISCNMHVWDCPI